MSCKFRRPIGFLIVVLVITQSRIVHSSVYLRILLCNLNFLPAFKHYSNISETSHFPGDSVHVSTVDDDKLETSRQFEVRLMDPTENPLNILDPNHVIITIIDNDGERKCHSLIMGVIDTRLFLHS